MRRFARLALMCCAVACVLNIGAVSSAYAQVAEVYQATMTPHYAHPVTGEVEDAGGKKSMAIGSGMVEGSTSPEAYVEVEDDGTMYALVRMVLMEYVDDVAIYVNDVPSAYDEIQQTESVSDFRVQIPDENAIIKVTMFVEPMGRDVVFFMTLSDFVPLESGDALAAAAASAADAAGSMSAQTQALVDKAEEKAEREEQEGKSQPKKSRSKKKKSEKKDELTPKRNEAAAKIFKLENLEKSEKQEFSDRAKQAKDESELESILAEAEAADKEAGEEKDLGRAKTEALQKITDLKNLSDDKKQAYKTDIKAAKTKDEINQIVEEAENESKPNMSLYIIIVFVVLTAITGGIGYMSSRKNKKEATNEHDA